MIYTIVKKKTVYFLILSLLVNSIFVFVPLTDIVKAFDGGDGSASDPYQISNWTHLFDVGMYMDKNFTLNNDLNETIDGYDTYVNTTYGWYPLGSDEMNTPFTGTFDGQNHSINNLFISRGMVNGDYAGLFAEIRYANISNIKFSSVNITDSASLGTLAGRVMDSVVDNVHIEQGEVISYATSGGLAGVVNTSSISNSSFTGTVISYGVDPLESSHAGGFAGQILDSIIVNCSSGGGQVISSTEETSAGTGGFAGHIEDSSIYNSSSSMDVEAEGSEELRYTGGFVGWLQKSIGGGDPMTIQNCFASGDVVGAWYAGGFVGANFDDYINNSYATGEVSGYMAGGFAGYNVGTITNCYAMGDVYDYDNGSGDNIPLLGGFIGHAGGGFYNCYSTGAIYEHYADSTDNIGGFAGNVIDGTEFDACFWDVKSSGYTEAHGWGLYCNATGLTTAEMKTMSPFSNAGWDIEESSTDLNNGYPFLSWQLGNSPTWYIFGGNVTTNVWNEANTSEALIFDILITNQDGSETYLDTDCEYNISFDTIDIPHGEKTIFIVNSDGFKQRIYYYDILPGAEYEFDFYLPPENPDPYYEQTLQTITRAVTNPDADVVFTLGCTPRHIVSVQAWNESLYGHWYTISQDNYTLSEATLTVNNGVFDANTSVVQVNYYCLDSEDYALQYMLKVVGPQEEYGYDPPISDVLVGIKTYIERTGEWENVSRLYTDANGQVDVYLIPGSLYKVTISKEGYNTGQSDIIPSLDIRTHTLRLIPEDFDFPDYESFWNDIILAGSLADGNLTVTFYDSTGLVTDTDIRAYSLYDGVETLINTDSRTGETSFTYNVSTNTTRDHRLKLWFNTSATYNISIPISIIIYGGVDSWRDEAKFNLSARFEALFGPFILDYADTICILIALIALALFGPFHAGIGIITCGLSVLLVQSLFSVHTVNSNAWMFALGVFVLILGILYMITTNTEEMV